MALLRHEMVAQRLLCWNGLVAFFKKETWRVHGGSSNASHEQGKLVVREQAGRHTRIADRTCRTEGAANTQYGTHVKQATFAEHARGTRLAFARLQESLLFPHCAG